MNKLRLAFEKFDRDNPHVYDLFKRFAFEAADAGVSRLSAGFIYERIRWETDVVIKGETRLPNNHRAYYARKFVDEFPHATVTFRLNTLRSEA